MIEIILHLDSFFVIIFPQQAVGKVYTSAGSSLWSTLHSVPGHELQYWCASTC